MRYRNFYESKSKRNDFQKKIQYVWDYYRTSTIVCIVFEQTMKLKQMQK